MEMKDNPYKPGTQEFKDFEKVLIQDQQLNTVDRQIAISIADKRLAQLKLQITPNQRSLALTDLINSLPKPGETFTNSQLLIQEVNTIWLETKLGIQHNFYTYVPEIVSAPNWVTKEQLYRILYLCVGVDIKMLALLYLRWAVNKPINFNKKPDEYELSYDQVETRFVRY